jgi:hypothetical protein
MFGWAHRASDNEIAMKLNLLVTVFMLALPDLNAEREFTVYIRQLCFNTE